MPLIESNEKLYSVELDEFDLLESLMKKDYSIQDETHKEPEDTEIRYGKFTGKTIREVLNGTNDDKKYLAWMRGTTKSEYLKKMITKSFENYMEKLKAKKLKAVPK